MNGDGIFNSQGCRDTVREILGEEVELFASVNPRNKKDIENPAEKLTDNNGKFLKTGKRENERKTSYYRIQLRSITYSPYNTTFSHSIGLMCAKREISMPASCGLHSVMIRSISFACQKMMQAKISVRQLHVFINPAKSRLVILPRLAAFFAKESEKGLATSLDMYCNMKSVLNTRPNSRLAR